MASFKRDRVLIFVWRHNNPTIETFSQVFYITMCPYPLMYLSKNKYFFFVVSRVLFFPCSGCFQDVPQMPHERTVRTLHAHIGMY